MIKSF
jgi:hypothetical protein